MVKLLRFNESISSEEKSLITLDDVLNIQKETIENFGGKVGVRDMNQLMSCINKIYMSVFGEDAYPTIYEKAAAFFESVVNTHPLMDGNKRTAFEGMVHILSNDGIKINKTYNQSRQFIINVVNKQLSINDIARWIKRNSKLTEIEKNK